MRHTQRGSGSRNTARQEPYRAGLPLFGSLNCLLPFLLVLFLAGCKERLENYEPPVQLTISETVPEAGSRVQENRAVLCGITNFKDGEVLPGCREDAQSIGKFLREETGGLFHSVIELLDDECVKARVMAAWEDCLLRAVAGDTRLVSYSAHGAKIRGGPESDGQDELLTCWDFNWTESTFIRDDELRNLLLRVPNGVNAYVILDTCHSGGMQRVVLSNQKVRQWPKLAPENLRPLAGAKSRAKLSDLPNVAILAMCEEDEYSLSMTVGNDVYGAGTRAWLPELRTGGRGRFFNTIAQDTRKRLKAEGNKDQNPRADGGLIAKPFSVLQRLHNRELPSPAKPKQKPAEIVPDAAPSPRAAFVETLPPAG